MMGQIPVYISRFTRPLPEGYGALIGWNAGERFRTARGTTGVILDGELKLHDKAPEIESARGRGRWVIEVRVDGKDSDDAVCAGFLLLPESAP